MDELARSRRLRGVRDEKTYLGARFAIGEEDIRLIQLFEDAFGERASSDDELVRREGSKAQVDDAIEYFNAELGGVAECAIRVLLKLRARASQVVGQRAPQIGVVQRQAGTVRTQVRRILGSSFGSILGDFRLTAADTEQY